MLLTMLPVLNDLINEWKFPIALSTLLLRLLLLLLLLPTVIILRLHGQLLIKQLLVEMPRQKPQIPLFFCRGNVCMQSMPISKPSICLWTARAYRYLRLPRALLLRLYQFTKTLGYTGLWVHFLWCCAVCAQCQIWLPLSGLYWFRSIFSSGGWFPWTHLCYFAKNETILGSLLSPKKWILEEANLASFKREVYLAAKKQHAYIHIMKHVSMAPYFPLYQEIINILIWYISDDKTFISIKGILQLVS